MCVGVDGGSGDGKKMRMKKEERYDYRIETEISAGITETSVVSTLAATTSWHKFTDSRSAQTQKLSRRMQRMHDISIMRVYASTIESEY